MRSLSYRIVFPISSVKLYDYTHSKLYGKVAKLWQVAFRCNLSRWFCTIFWTSQHLWSYVEYPWAREKRKKKLCWESSVILMYFIHVINILSQRHNITTMRKHVTMCRCRDCKARRLIEVLNLFFYVVFYMYTTSGISWFDVLIKAGVRTLGVSIEFVKIELIHDLSGRLFTCQFFMWLICP